MKIIILTIGLLAFLSCKENSADIIQEAVITSSIAPIETDASYLQDQENHYIARNTTLRLNKLLLFIGGSYSVPANYNLICDHAASIGLDVISLSYPNNVPAASLAANPDFFIFDKYREEICFGNPVSEAIEVDELNSIAMRTEKLLIYLANTYPNENWSFYLNSQNKPEWSRIIIGGHSQGAGHAAYLGKRQLLDRVVLFAGPNDYHTYYQDAANWLKEDGITPSAKHYALLAREDELVAFDQQVINLKELGLLSANENPVKAEGLSPPYQNAKVLSIDIPALSNHNSVVGGNEILPEIWTYMLTFN